MLGAELYVAEQLFWLASVIGLVSDEISAAAYDWITFSHSIWVASWGLGILLVGFILRRV